MPYSNLQNAEKYLTTRKREKAVTNTSNTFPQCLRLLYLLNNWLHKQYGLHGNFNDLNLTEMWRWRWLFRRKNLSWRKGSVFSVLSPTSVYLLATIIDKIPQHWELSKKISREVYVELPKQRKWVGYPRGLLHWAVYYVLIINTAEKRIRVQWFASSLETFQ